MRIRIDSVMGLVCLIAATLPSSFGQEPINRTVTSPLTKLDATGIYAPYVGGHNHMVDLFHSLNGDFLTNPNAPGPFDEDCYCIISVPGGLPLLWWTSK